MNIHLEAHGFGDAEVYVDGLMSHHLHYVTTSVVQPQDVFHLVDDTTRRIVGTVYRRHNVDDTNADAAAQIAQLLGGTR